MVRAHARISTFLDRQHQQPSGIVGRVIGERMARQHAVETRWTLDQLAISPGDRVLELGCGAGRAMELAATHTAHGQVVGLDLSATMVQAARQRNAGAEQRGRVALLRGDATTLPFAGEQYDRVFSIHTFYFWQDPLRAIADIFRVLKPQGMLVVTLSTGVIGPGGEREPGRFGPLQNVLDEQVIPGMERMGFTTARVALGPDNRQFNSVAIIGRK